MLINQHKGRGFIRMKIKLPFSSYYPQNCFALNWAICYTQYPMIVLQGNSIREKIYAKVYALPILRIIAR